MINMDTLEVESMTLPTSVLKDCRQNITRTTADYESASADVFVETGSYDGRTIHQALYAGYNEVHSIELNVDYHEMCKRRFYNDERVHLYRGDSEIELGHVLANINIPATFWLDAHIQEGTVGLHAAPILHEIVAIRNHHIKNHILMIDDIRLMGRGWWQDVTLDAVKGLILTINPRYKFEQVNSKAAARDILIARVE